jgi:FkbM family methyltransferase
VKYIKFIIDLLFIPLVKIKPLFSYLLNNPFRKELESRLENGGLFPMQHIHRSIRLAKRLPDQDFIILDIGGGIGASLRLYLKYFPANRIMLFEPVKESFKTIESKYGKSGNVTFCNLAVGNEKTVKEINIANRVTSSSILPLSAETESVFYDEKTLGLNRNETIEIVRLDDFLKNKNDKIGIMKLDVQGFEMNVLQGAEETLKRTSLILLEAGNHDVYVGSPKYYEIDEYLRAHGFTLYDIIPSVLDKGQLKEWDVIYIANSALCGLQ